MAELKFSFLKAFPKPDGTYYLEWAIERHPETDISFYVYYAPVPLDNEMRFLAGPLVEVYHYQTEIVFRMDRNSKDYFRIRAIWDNNEQYSDFFFSAYVISPEVRFIYKEDLFFLRQFINEPIKIYLKKKSGRKCGKCYDPIKERVIREDCNFCFGTGIEGGYYGPFESYWQRGLRPDVKMLTPQGMIRLVSENSAWTVNFPLISPDDLIYSVNEGLFYRANVVERPAYKGYPIRQYLQDLMIVPLGSPEYKLVS